MLSVLSVVLSIDSPITTQLNTGYSVALVYRQMMSAASVLPHLGEAARSPPLTDRFLRELPDSHSSVLRERPFGVASLAMSPRAWSLLVGSESSLLRMRSSGDAVSFGSAGDHSPRACPGRAAVLAWFPLAYSGSRVEMSDLERVPVSPLRISKRARASLFSKLQRANGGCLGA